MKLELKHLAPYLPYGLKIQGQTHGEIAELSCITETSVNIKVGGLNRSFTYGMWADIFEIKPILRPLSDLTKENIVKLKLFIEADRDFIIESPLYCDYEDIQYLLSEHFDVFGLIPEGLAININILDD